MTPRETLMTIEASIWRNERRQELDLVQAWSMAKLMRAKRIPPLKALLNTKPAKPLRGKELEKARQEFKELNKNLNLKKIAERMKKVRHGQ